VLSKGRQVRLGLLAAIAFMIGLVPLMSWYELGNVPLVALALLLLGRDYDRSLIDMVHRQQSGRHLPGTVPHQNHPRRQPLSEGLTGLPNGGQDDSTDDSQTPPHAHRTTT
jgi:hypothetical protein